MCCKLCDFIHPLEQQCCGQVVEAFFELCDDVAAQGIEPVEQGRGIGRGQSRRRAVRLDLLEQAAKLLALRHGIRLIARGECIDLCGEALSACGGGIDLIEECADSVVGQISLRALRTIAGQLCGKARVHVEQGFLGAVDALRLVKEGALLRPLQDDALAVGGRYAQDVKRIVLCAHTSP